MNSKQLSVTLALGLGVLSSQLTLANDKSATIVYGDDNRIETYEADIKLQKLASSTAGMFGNVKGIDTGKNMMLPPYSLGEEMGLCKGEKFSEQPSSVACSGFLVGPDLLVTAGHCIQTQSDCESVSWVFDYKVKQKTGKTDVLVDKDNVYKCSKVIESKLYSSQTLKEDYALVKLDRVVKGRTPLKFRTTGKIKSDTALTVIGHPSGLPQKVAGDAKVVLNNHTNFFKTNLDTFGGNSGSAVFNTDTLEVEGILVRGAKDYESSNEGCIRVHKTDHEVTDFMRYGESVSRITEIKTLKYRGMFFKAIESGDTVKALEISKKLKDISIYNNDMENALHIASKLNDVKMMSLLIELGVNIDAQNLSGETPLHIAVKNSSKLAVMNLIENNADTLIKDHFGKTPRQSAKFFSLRIKKGLKRAEVAQKKKKKKQASL